MSVNILVLGATGKVGSEVTTWLLKKGITPRIGTRHPDKYNPGNGGEAVLFDYTNPKTFDKALAGIEKVYVTAPPLDAEAHLKLIPFIDYAIKRNCKQFVLLSALGVDKASGSPLNLVEKHLKATGAVYTIVRPSFFMENFYPGWMYQGIKASKAISLPAGNGKTAFISVADIGAVVAEVLTNPVHQNKEYNITGGKSITHKEVADVLSQTSGQNIIYIDCKETDYKATLEQFGVKSSEIEYILTLYQSVKAGYTDVITPDTKQILNRDPISFEQYAAKISSVWA